jgi:hypothetical protein
MIMQEYPIKRGHTKGFEVRMADGLEKYFGSAAAPSGGHYTIAYGALKRLEVWSGENGKSLMVDTESDFTVDEDAVILDTNRRFRDYLQYVTGYTAKERAKKVKKAAEKEE